MIDQQSTESSVKLIAPVRLQGRSSMSATMVIIHAIEQDPSLPAETKSSFIAALKRFSIQLLLRAAWSELTGSDSPAEDDQEQAPSPELLHCLLKWVIDNWDKLSP